MIWRSRASLVTSNRRRTSSVISSSVFTRFSAVIVMGEVYSCGAVKKLYGLRAGERGSRHGDRSALAVRLALAGPGMDQRQQAGGSRRQIAPAQGDQADRNRQRRVGEEHRLKPFAPLYGRQAAFREHADADAGADVMQHAQQSIDGDDVVQAETRRDRGAVHEATEEAFRWAAYERLVAQLPQGNLAALGQRQGVRAGHDRIERFLAEVCALHQVRHRVHITDSEIGNAAPYILEDVELAALAYPHLDQGPRL